MYQKMNLQQLQTLSIKQLNLYKEDVAKRKAELGALKVKGGDNWNAELQDELDEVTLLLVDIDDTVEEKQNEATSAMKNNYYVAPGTEKMVHLQLVRGRRFNPLTGKEESKAYTQMFTFAEWQLFKKNFVGLGYTIMAALHDPYGDAEELVTKNK